VSPLFLLLSDASPPTDVVMTSHCVTLPSYEAKMSSLALLHLSATLHHVASPLFPRAETEALIDHPPRIV
jgi:hypothetical protein